MYAQVAKTLDMQVQPSLEQCTELCFIQFKNMATPLSERNIVLQTLQRVRFVFLCARALYLLWVCPQ